MAKRHGHHGGAWKVAYADFVTAMMALFLVLWLTSQDTKIKEAIERSFRNPFLSLTKESVGIIPNKDVNAIHEQRGKFESINAVEMELLRRLTEDLAKMFQENPDEASNSVKLQLTDEGLRVNLFDRSHKPIFLPDSSDMSEYGIWVLSTLAWEISRYTTFNIEVEGHTESGRSVLQTDYGDWELSADRANSARRLLTKNGVLSQQISKVAGYADTLTIDGKSPKDETNRRVTVLLRTKNKTSNIHD